MTILETYETWLAYAADDPDLQTELKTLPGDENSPELRDRFYRNLEFGTGGLRGVLGAGSNRMNIYTVRAATQGLAEYMHAAHLEKKAAIAYDSRIKSGLFAKEAARVLAANGITAFLYPRLMPTPALSFAVRNIKCGAGICITASHNPAGYNGYKVYDADGCQITPQAAEEIQALIPAGIFRSVKLVDFETAVGEGNIQYIGEHVIEAYLDVVKKQRINQNIPSVKVVYTPLNGAGLECVTRVLRETKLADVTVVPGQDVPDGSFPTCPYPNPEEEAALEKGLALCRGMRPDLLLATDPDCDRVGIAARENGGYRRLSGNEAGILLFHYICEQRAANRTMPGKPVAVKTIVTTDMAAKVAKQYGVELWEVPTGFKYIGDCIRALEQNGKAGSYIFGFEESCGYLSGAYVRDKDAVGASLLICEMAGYYKQRGLSLPMALEKLYEEYGFYKDKLCSLTFTGEGGSLKMQDFMQALRASPPASFGGFDVLETKDYLKNAYFENADYRIPVRPDVLEFRLAKDCKIIIRPSGTEPKMKIYLSAYADSHREAERNLEKLSQLPILRPCL